MNFRANLLYFFNCFKIAFCCSESSGNRIPSCLPEFTYYMIFFISVKVCLVFKELYTNKCNLFGLCSLKKITRKEFFLKEPISVLNCKNRNQLNKKKRRVVHSSYSINIKEFIPIITPGIYTKLTTLELGNIANFSLTCLSTLSILLHLTNNTFFN